MRASRKDRLGFWLERWAILHPLLLEYSHKGPKGPVYVNRLNGHLIVKAAA